MEDDEQKTVRLLKQRAEKIRERVVGRLVEIRNEESISIRQSAKRSTLARSTVRDVESGVQKPSLETLILLADAIDADLPSILREEIQNAGPEKL